MHAHAWHVRYVDDEAHLTREASAGDGEPNDRGSGCGSALTHLGRQAAIAVADGGEDQVTYGG